MLRTIQCSRGIAAIGVVLYHLSNLAAEPRSLGQPVGQWLFWRGDLGVDFFFVLSGFIIAFAHAGDLGQPARLGHFAIKRFTRVYPVYWLYVAMFAAVFVLGLTGNGSIPHDPVNWASTLSLVRLTAELPPLRASWTLFHEVLFYGLFASLILNRRFGMGVLAVWAALILVANLTPLGSAVFGDVTRPPAEAYLSIQNLNFFAGIGSYVLWRRASPGVCRLAFAAGAVLLVATFWVEALGTRVPLVQTPCYALGFAGIVAGLVSWDAVGRPTPPRLLLLLGNASYSIYLTHEPAQGALMRMATRAHLPALIGPAGVYVVVAVLVIATGVLAYRVLELPLLRLVRLAVSGRKAGRTASARAMVVQ